MRDRHRRHEQLLKAWFRRSLDLDHLACGALHLVAGRSREERVNGARTRRVADGPHSLERTLRDHAEHEGVGRIEMGTERAGQPDVGHEWAACVLEEQIDAGP